jgi:cytochrome c oxidase cbb3-type subunit 2
LPEVGEYAYDLPHLLSTRRIGPDILRVGGKYGDDWHSAHFFDPRMVVPDSVMPRFTWFFKKEGDRFVLNNDGIAVVAYVQNLGMGRGKWRDEFPYQIAAQGSAPAFTTKESVDHGKEVYLRRCIGCHGEKGDGKGKSPMLVQFDIALPRDFTAGAFKFRTTPSGALPLDSDLYRTITAGIRGAAMPPWFNLPEEDRWDVIHYIKTFSPLFTQLPPEQPLYIPEPAVPTLEIIAQGKKTFELLKCWECHGREGKGDGPKSDTLQDDFGNRIPPANFTKGIFKSGPRPQDLFRTFMTGLNGTPMPTFVDTFTQFNIDPWALTYYVLSLSADKQTEAGR